MDIPAYRGMITDRNDTPLAVSTPVESVFVNPKVFAPSPTQLQQIAHIANISAKTLATRIKEAKQREFLYIQRQLPPMVAKKIEALHIPGINFQQEFKRYYPGSESIAQLLGFTNIDDRGLKV